MVLIERGMNFCNNNEKLKWGDWDELWKVTPN